MAMKPADTDQILQALSANPADGVSLMALSRRTGKSLPELQKFMQAHRTCFNEIGQTKYTLNPNPPINGRLESAQCQLQIESSRKRQLQVIRWAGVSAAIFVAFYLLTVFI